MAIKMHRSHYLTFFALSVLLVPALVGSQLPGSVLATCASTQLGAPRAFSQLNLPLAVAVADFNGDGSPDVVTANDSSNTISVLLGNGAGGVAGSSTVATGSHPIAVAVGDLNNDGKIDIVTANTFSNNLSIFIGNGGGGFAPAVNLTTGASSPSFVIVADLNHDSNADLAIAHSDGVVAVLLGNGTGNFVPATNLAVGDRLLSMTVGDFNLDGNLDLAAVRQQDNKVSILPGDGTGGFGTISSYVAGSETTDVEAGDLNNDGRLDLLVSFYANGVAVLLNQGDGSFGPPTVYSLQGQTPASAVAIADFNNDGNADLVAGNVTGISVRFGDGSGVFGAPTDYPGPLGQPSLAIGDFNGDGSSDVAVAGYSAGSVWVILNDGTGHLNVAPHYPTGSDPHSVRKADFNNDGKIDLAVCNRNSNDVSVVLGDGNGGFGTTRNFSVGPPPQTFAGNQPFSLAAGDLNNDGKIDLVTADFTGAAISVLMGDGAGNFPSATKVNVGGSPWWVELGEFNGDGKLDAVVSRNGSDVLLVLLGNGDGSFASPTSISGLQGPRPIAVGDLNGDNKADIVAGNQSSGNVLWVFLGNGSGGFSGPVSYPLESFAGPSSIAIGDLTGDGKPDLVVSEEQKNKVAVLTGDGLGAFSASVTYAVGSHPTGVTIADLNDDGFRDVAVANSQAQTVSVFLNNGNGTLVPAADYGTFGAHSVIAGDFNQDNRIDLATDGFDSLLNSCPVTPVGIPEISINDVTVSEESGSATLTVSLSVAGSLPTSVKYYSMGQSAVSGIDFQSISGTVVFQPGETSKTLSVPILNDSLNELTESFSVNLYSSNNGKIRKRQGNVAITDSDPLPSISINNSSVNEGSSGTAPAIFTVNLSQPSGKMIRVGYVTSNGTATAGQDYVATAGTITIGAGQTTKSGSVPVIGDTLAEPDETFFVDLANPVNVAIGNGHGTITIINDVPIQFSSASYNVSEDAGSIDLVITRASGATAGATVNYMTTDNAGASKCNVQSNAASSRCDYLAIAAGTVSFAANETSKTISIAIVDDAYPESAESFAVTLTSSNGASLGSPATATVTITDNDAALGPNPIDGALFMVRQHYLDFLSRQPDQSGWDFWSNQITSCGSDVQCTEVKRINVSASFFLSIEFQQTGYLVERFHKTAYGDASGSSTLNGSHVLPVPVVRANEFSTDTQRIGRGVVVLQAGWEQALENNKQAYALEFAQTSRFVTALPTAMTPAQFVDKLNQNAGNVLSPSERATAINTFDGAGDTTNVTARAQVLRQIAEDQDLYNAELNRAFVLAQYFGYLRRNPNDAPDADYTGYEFWLNKLNQFNGDYIAAEMVKAFISSSEYRQRFGP